MLPKSAARTHCYQAYWMLKALLKIVRSSSSAISTASECVHCLLSGFPSVADLASSTLGGEKPQTPADTHQCTFCYRINSRPFAAPLDAQVACPVCKMPKSEYPHTEREPALIRVSIPCSTLLPAYKIQSPSSLQF